MRSEFIPVYVSNLSFDQRFRFMWISICRDGRLMLGCNSCGDLSTDCHSFSNYINDVLYIHAFDEFTCEGIHYVFTNYRIVKFGSIWYFRIDDIILYKASVKSDMLSYVRFYFLDKFNRLE